MCKVFYQDLDEDTRGRCGVILVQLDDIEYMPADGIGRQKMSEELSNDAEAVRFVTVDRVVVFDEHFFEEVLPQPVELAEAFTNQAEELVIRSFLAAALDDHGWQFIFSASG